MAITVARDVDATGAKRRLPFRIECVAMTALTLWMKTKTDDEDKDGEGDAIAKKSEWQTTNELTTLVL